jgi:Putative transposase
MKNTNPYSIHPKHLQNAKALRRAKTQEATGTATPPPTASTIRTTPRDFVNPVDYQHPYDSMARYAQALALYYDANDGRIRQVSAQAVCFRWKNRDANRQETHVLPGVEFVQRYLRHVLPQGLRAIRYYGFCHPTAKSNRLRVQLHTGRCLQFGATTTVTPPPAAVPQCPCCRQPMRLVCTFLSQYRQRGPPSVGAQFSSSLSA